MAEDTRSQREDFQEARKALVDKVVKENPGLSHQDFNDVKIADFDDHAAGLRAQRAEEGRQAAAAYFGITVEELDARKAADASNGAAKEPTAEQRTASLPAGKAPTLPPPATSETTDVARTGVEKLEDAANEFLANSGFLKR
jgi:hypothetical protein